MPLAASVCNRMVIFLQDSEVAKKPGMELSLDEVTENNRLVRLKKLEVEGQNHFMNLVQFQGSPHISR